jgi:hypothetical protein
MGCVIREYSASAVSVDKIHTILNHASPALLLFHTLIILYKALTPWKLALTRITKLPRWSQLQLPIMNTLRTLARPLSRSTEALRPLSITKQMSGLSYLGQDEEGKVCISNASHAPYLLQDKEFGLGFIRSNPRTPKPRKRGMTEIRGPYYSAYGKRHLQDIMDTMGHHVDGLKFAGGSFSLMPEKSVTELIKIAHQNDVYVSTASTKYVSHC